MKRRIFEEKIIKGICFLVMKKEEFISVVLDCKILILKEVVSIVEYLNLIFKFFVGFFEMKRFGFVCEIYWCCRFEFLSVIDWFYNGEKCDVINFWIDSEDIVLYGVCLFGSENSIYLVDLDLINIKSILVVVLKIGIFLLELL